jgi:alanyl-tRNA synthetase
MNSDEIRQIFLHFFEGKGHKIVPGSSLIPLGDPTLLLTSAGMVQFKPYFTGEAIPPSPRLASCQKCFRVTDIDSVGDSTHLTFFEMLGNFSVGDYFKREAIAWAWEFVIERLKLPQERLWVSIFLDDDEAFRYWREVGVAEERILRFGEEDNFWGPAGNTGPCGPCSEIHYDLGKSVGCGKPDCGPNCDCGRFSEIWNLVFTQYDQLEDGSRIPLPKPNIDTGMGLERTAAAMQGKVSVYETDLFAPLIERASQLSDKMYGGDKTTDRALRIVAEHARAISFLLADGVMPSNEGRGYVLRRVLRRAVLFGRKLGLHEPFLSDLAKITISQMQHEYPELKRERKFILSTIEAEESRFNQTLEVGLNLLDTVIEESKKTGKGTISGQDIFRLYDTYGFPKEITAEIAAENGLALDLDGFEVEMERQRERARAAQKVIVVRPKPARAVARVSGPTVIISGPFVGYRKLKCNSTAVKLWVDGQEVETAHKCNAVDIVLEETAFYGEMGGQVGDTGQIVGPNGIVQVVQTARTANDITVHHGEVVEGTMSVGEAVEAVVDRERRLDIARNHTATHLLQAALRQVLGEHVRQSGSVVAPHHLTFDFSHSAALTDEQLSEVQRIVNEMVRQNLTVRDKMMPYQQARDAGALAFFEEKYGDEVRALEIGRPPISIELCGGTHVKRTGDIGFFQIVAEASIGAGLRRIEAVTGRGAEEFIKERLSIIEHVADELKAPVAEIENRIAALQAEMDVERKKAIALERRLLTSSIDSILDKAESVNGITVLTARVSASDMEALRQTGDLIKERLNSVLLVLGADCSGRANFVAMVTPDLVKKGLHAGNIVKQVAAVAGGSGGGKAEVGQAGGKDVSRLDDALRLVKELVAKHGDTGT